MLPNELRQLVHDELTPGEQIRWLGQPHPRISFGLQLYLVVFGLFGTMFMIYWMAGAAGIKNPWSFPPDLAAVSGVGAAFSLLGLPGIVIAVACIFAPLWLPGRVRRVASRTAYVVTDKRAIVFDGSIARGQWGFFLSGLSPLKRHGTHIQSYTPDQLRSLARTERDDGSGDLIIETVIKKDSDGEINETRYGFYAIAKVAEVERLLKELAASIE